MKVLSQMEQARGKREDLREQRGSEEKRKKKEKIISTRGKRVDVTHKNV